MQQDTNTDARDLAVRSGGMPLAQLEMRLSDMENEPAWRDSANKCADYYDHKQSSAARIERHQRTGEPMTTINLIQRTVNGALGQEAKSRLNWKCEADSGVLGDMAGFFSERLHELQREARTDMAISEAYSSMLRTGIGWVEVSRNPDPLAYPYRVTAVHRNEVWWDWRAKESDKSDGMWVIRQRWVDLDEAVAKFPKFREMLEVGCHSGPITDSMARTILTSADTFESLHMTRRSFSRVEEEWLDNSVRKRVRFYDVYYKRPVQAVALVVGSRRVKFNPRNPIHAALVQRGSAKLLKGASYEIRHAMFAGPFRLFDVPLRGRRFPLVPFVCYSADDDRSPYGLVHGMIEPQDEFNERRSRLMWLLKARQVFVDGDALDPEYNTLADLAVEVMRPDAMFVLNKNRMNKDAMRIEANSQLQAEQVAVMQDSKQLIQDVPGLYAALLGSGADGAKSGVAINSLVEQSVASLGETSDNYRTSRREVGELCMELLIEDHELPNMEVELGTGSKRRSILLNSKTPEGLPVNSVEDAPVRVALGDVPTTAAFRGQQQIFLTQALQTAGNNPTAQAVLIPALLEAGDLEHRHLYARWMRQQAGVPEPEDLGDEDAMAEQVTQRQQAQGAAQEMQMRDAAATVAKKENDAALSGAKAQREAAAAQAEGMQVQQMAAAMQAPIQPQPLTPDQLAMDALQEASAA